MPEYAVYVFCNECGDVHPMGIQIALKDGPKDKQSVGDTYSGRDLPTNIVNMINNYTLCPKTNELFLQKNNDQVFLVPV